MLKRSRIAILAVLVFAMLGLYSFQLMQYQVIDGASYRVRASTTSTAKMSIIAPRGEILDRYGRVLASSSVGYSILLEWSIFPSNKHLQAQNDELLQLSSFITAGGAQCEDDLPVTAAAPYKWADGTGKSDIRRVVKNINGSLNKVKLPDTATVQQVLAALASYYETQGYTAAQQRTLAGIHYTMLEKAFSYTKVYTLATGVNIQTVTAIQERSMSLPGVTPQQVPVRSYSDSAIMPSIVGTTGPIPQESLADYTKKGYSTDAVVGRSGIEKYLENYLRGQNGEEQVELTTNGDLAQTPTILTAPQPGDNVVLTIDSQLQQTVQNMLPQVIAQVKAAAAGDPNRAGSRAKAASTVVLDVKTGEVLAMASYPTYTREQYKNDYSSLASDTANSPLLDRALQSAYTPGSTFKPIVATAGLMNGTITPDTTWTLPSSFQVGTWIGTDDEGRARVANLRTALAVSSNIFFYKLGSLAGIDAIDKVANAMGIGQDTGIELKNESAGSLSSIAEENAKGLPWYPANTPQASIGQLSTTVTPLQLANYVSTLVKGGTQYQVHIVRQVNNSDNTKVIVNNTKPAVKSKFAVTAGAVEAVKEGMLAVATDPQGTAYSVYGNFAMKVGAKTGTAQVHPKGSIYFYTDYNAVFICFAPYGDPEIAIATVVEYGHNGYQTAPVSKAAIQQYFSLDANGNSVIPSVSVQKTDTLLP